MKAVKRFFKIVFWILIVLLVLVLALPLWIGPVAKGVANSVTPGIVGTDFRMGEFGLNPYTGRLHVGDLQLANPTNFNPENCVDLKDLDVKILMGTLTDKKIIIDEIILDGLRVSSTADAGNFKQIAANASGPETPEEATAPEATPPGTTATELATTEPAAEEAQPGVQINRIVLSNITVKYGMLPIPLPTIELLDIGKESEEGATFMEVCQQIYAAIMKSVGAVGDLGKALGTGALDLGSSATDATLEFGKDLGSGAMKLEGAAVDSIKNLFHHDKKKK